MREWLNRCKCVSDQSIVPYVVTQYFTMREGINRDWCSLVSHRVTQGDRKRSAERESSTSSSVTSHPAGARGSSSDNRHREEAQMTYVVSADCFSPSSSLPHSSGVLRSDCPDDVVQTPTSIVG